MKPIVNKDKLIGDSKRLLSKNNLFVFRCNKHKEPMCKWTNHACHEKPKTKLLKKVAQGQFSLGVTIPKNVVVIDVDSIDAMATLENKIGLQRLQDTTLSVRTGRGWHLYYIWPKSLPHTELKYQIPSMANIDIRPGSSSHYMIVPPTFHYGMNRFYEFNSKYDTPQKLPKQLKRYIKDCYQKINKPNTSQIYAPQLDSKNSPRSVLSNTQLGHALNTLDAEIFSNRLYDDDGFFALLASVHYATAGRNSAREIFINWASTDNAYNTNSHKRANRAMWNACQNRKRNSTKRTDRTLQWILRRYAVNLRPGFFHEIEVTKVRNRFLNKF